MQNFPYDPLHIIFQLFIDCCKNENIKFLHTEQKHHELYQFYCKKENSDDIICFRISYDFKLHTNINTVESSKILLFVDNYNFLRTCLNSTNLFDCLEELICDLNKYNCIIPDLNNAISRFYSCDLPIEQ